MLPEMDLQFVLTIGPSSCMIPERWLAGRMPQLQTLKIWPDADCKRCRGVTAALRDLGDRSHQPAIVRSPPSSGLISCFKHNRRGRLSFNHLSDHHVASYLPADTFNGLDRQIIY
jgi:hypothetical protein